MDITTFSREKIEHGLSLASQTSPATYNSVKVIFSPRFIKDENFEDVCKMYSQLAGSEYETVVVIESHPGSAEKKLPMPSFKQLETPLGIVFANDKLRNEFADEDDDFFVNDDAFEDDVSLLNQVMMLQSTLQEFTLLNIQITDESTYIIKELAFAVEEILASRNALIVCCCEMGQNGADELNKVIQMVDSGNDSGVMNYLNSGDSTVHGVGSFIAGLIIGKKWNLTFQFPSQNFDESVPKNPLIGLASLQREPIFRE